MRPSRQAVRANTAALLPSLRLLSPPLLTLNFHLGDVTGDGLEKLLPGLWFSSSSSSHELAVPDYTFASYPAAAPLLGASSGTLAPWDEVLEAASSFMGGRARDEAVVWRGDADRQPIFQRRLPLEQQKRREKALRKFSRLHEPLARIGLRQDVRKAPPLSWEDMCRARFALHVDGSGASNALKYRLACGNVVLRVRGLNQLGRFVEPQLEWWELLEPPKSGTEWIEIVANLSTVLSHLQALQATPSRAAAIGQAAARYARRVLSPAVVRCYWLTLLQEYARLFGAWRRTCGPRGQLPGEANATRSGLVAGRAGERVPGCFALGSDPCYRSWVRGAWPEDVRIAVAPVVFEFA